MLWLQCIEKMGKGCLNDECMTSLVTILEKILKSHFEKQSKRQDVRKEEDYDEDVEEALLDEVCDVTRSHFRLCRSCSALRYYCFCRRMTKMYLF